MKLLGRSSSTRGPGEPLQKPGTNHEGQGTLRLPRVHGLLEPQLHDAQAAQGDLQTREAEVLPLLPAAHGTQGEEALARGRSGSARAAAMRARAANVNGGRGRC